MYAPALDGGILLRESAAVSLGYWLVVLIIVIRRRQHPTKLDLALIAFGYPVILFPCIYIVHGSL